MYNFIFSLRDAVEAALSHANAFLKPTKNILIHVSSQSKKGRLSNIVAPLSDANAEPSKTTAIKLFVKIVNGLSRFLFWL